MIPFILKSSSITLFPQGAAPLTIDDDHMNFEAVAAAIRAGNFDEAVKLASIKTYLNSISGGNVVVTDFEVTYKGAPISGHLASKIIAFHREGLPMAHYIAFLENLMANPSMTSRKELFLFLESADLPITDDGCFLAYKAVTSDFKDKHTLTFDNSPGQTLSMPRADVDDDRETTCSYGFHAAAYEYAKGFMSSGDRLVAVKINPADVVSVPSDYNNQKLRTCRYEVLFDIPDAADKFKSLSYYNTKTGS